LPRYYLGVDWADKTHQLYVSDKSGRKIKELEVPQTPEEMAKLGRWLDESRKNRIELWAAIEKPHGRIVDFLLDHGVVVYPVNPKALDRARDRFRMSPSKSDAFDAYVLAEFLRTDHAHLRALEPDSAEVQELKMLTRDHQRLVRQKTRLVNQIRIHLKSMILVRWRSLRTWKPRSRWIFSKCMPPRRPSPSLRAGAGTASPRASTTSVKHARRSFGTSSTSLSSRSPNTWLEPKRNFCWRWLSSWRPRSRRLTATTRMFKVFSPLCRQLKWPRRCPAVKPEPQ
jgi:hypothetical protein